MPDDLDFEKWSAEYEKHIAASPIASASWERLTKAGCEPDWLKLGAFLSCDFPGAPAYEILGDMKREGQQLVKRIRKLAGRLEEDRREVLVLAKEEEKLKLADETIWSAFADSSANIISRLKNTAQTTQREISARNLKPTLFVVLLAIYIQEKTRSPHYREITTLLDAAYSAFGKASSIAGEEALRKTVDRFKKRNPEIVNSSGAVDDSKIFIAVAVLVVLGLARGLIEIDNSQASVSTSQPESDKPQTREPLSDKWERLFSESKTTLFRNRK